MRVAALFGTFRLSLLSRILSGEQLICVLVILAFLIPVWAFRYFPTQDGPAHLANSLILKGYGDPGNRFQEFYHIAWEPLPNWTCFALLAGFSCVVPPLVAEKLLVSLYVIGFACSYRYFIGAVGNTSSWPVMAGFLLVFNRCLWMGFYNYCLSLVLFFVVLGYFLRRWERFTPFHALLLGLLLCCAFFTHLFGFVLAATSCLWLAVTLPPRRWRALVLLGAALLPAAVLTLRFFATARFFQPEGLGRLDEHLAGWVDGTGQWARIRRDAGDLDMQLFGIFTDVADLRLSGVVLLYTGFLALGLWKAEAEEPSRCGLKYSLFGLGLMLTLLYFLLPDVLTVGKGGFWKARLILLPPLLWLSCARPLPPGDLRYFLHSATLALLACQLLLVGVCVTESNRELEEFTAGVHAAGQNRVLYAHNNSRKAPNMSVNPLRHAEDYYCLGSRNINVGHHFATLRHSVVRLRSSIREGEGHVNSYPDRSLVEVVVAWGTAAERAPEGFRVIYRGGRLTIWERQND